MLTNTTSSSSFPDDSKVLLNPEAHNDRQTGQILIAEWNPQLLSYYLCLLVVIGICTVYGIVLFVPCVICCSYGLRKSFFESLETILTERSLIVRKGGNRCYNACCFKRVEKTILLDRIQDLTVSQNCLERCYSIESLTIETAGQAGPNAGPEAVLTGVKNPRAFRDAVLKARHDYVDNGITHSAGLGKYNPKLEMGPNQPLPSIEHKILLTDIKNGINDINQNLKQVLITK